MGSQQSASSESKINPLFDLIMDPDLQKNQWPKALQQQKHNQYQSVMVRCMNKELFQKYKNLKSSNGWTIARSINTGTLYPQSTHGCHTGDLESYHLFKDFFYPVIEASHMGYKLDGSMKHKTDLDGSKIQTNLEKSALSKIVSVRTRCARNLSMFPLNTIGTKQTRMQILQLVQKAVTFLPEDLQGTVYRHSDMSPEMQKKLINDHFLFKGGDKMQAASGYHLYWPYGRGIFLSNDKKFLMWINQGDHLRIISMQQGGDIQTVFKRFSKAVNSIQAAIRKCLELQKSSQVFLQDPILGNIACCPSNLGTCMRSSVHILLPDLIEKIGFKQIQKFAKQNNCQARGTMGQHSQVIDRIDISNQRRLGVSEYELIQDMIKCANRLANMQDQLKKKQIEK